MENDTLSCITQSHKMTHCPSKKQGHAWAVLLYTPYSESSFAVKLGSTKRMAAWRISSFNLTQTWTVTSEDERRVPNKYYCRWLFVVDEQGGQVKAGQTTHSTAAHCSVWYPICTYYSITRRLFRAFSMEFGYSLPTASIRSERVKVDCIWSVYWLTH